MIGAATSEVSFGDSAAPLMRLGLFWPFKAFRMQCRQHFIRGSLRGHVLFVSLALLFMLAAQADTNVNSIQGETSEGREIPRAFEGGGTGSKEVEGADAYTKEIAAVLIFFCAVLGALPAFVILRRQHLQRDTGVSSGSNSSSTCTVLPSCCSSSYGAAASACCFGASPFYVRAATVYTAGVVAAVALLHLLPAADRRLSKALEALKGQGGPRWGPHYPAAALCCLVGLLLSAAIEAVVEQRYNEQREDEDDGLQTPLASLNSVKVVAQPKAISPQLQLHREAAAGADARDGHLMAVGLPVQWSESKVPPPVSGCGPYCCVADIGGAPCRGAHLDVDVTSAPPGPVGRAYCAFPGSRHQRRYCGEPSCCNNTSGSNRGKNIWRDERTRPAAAASVAEAVAVGAGNSSTSNGEEDARILTCPYTLMGEGTIANSHMQQQKGGITAQGVNPHHGDPARFSPGDTLQEGSAFMGSLLLTGLSVHSLLEGLTLGAAPNPKTIAIAILFHKTLEAFAVGSSLLHVRTALRSYVLQMLFYAFTAPLGVAGGLWLQRSVDPNSTSAGGVGGPSPYLQLIPGFLIGVGAGAFLHVGLLEILASELQRCRREKRGDMLPMIGLTAVGALCMAFL